jgi:hypothetical protein
MRRAALGLAVACLVGVAPAAHASEYLGTPDYVHGIWFRVGYASDGHFSYGVSVEAQPWTVGVEISPRSPAGLVRTFGGLKSDVLWPGTSCAAFVGVGGFAVFAFGPGTAPQLGLRLDAHLRHMPMRNDGANGRANKTRRSEGISYDFTWLYGTGRLHDIGLELGAFRAPNSACYGD